MNWSKSDTGDVVVFVFFGVNVLLLAIFVIVGLLSLGENSGTSLMRAQAIESGVGYWEIDSETGERQFAWRRRDGSSD